MPLFDGFQEEPRPNDALPPRQRYNYADTSGGSHNSDRMGDIEMFFTETPTSLIFWNDPLEIFFPFFYFPPRQVLSEA